MKKLSFLLTFLLLLTLLASPSFAAEDPMTWAVSEDGKTLSNGQTDYTLYEIEGDAPVRQDILYVQCTILHPDGGSYRLATTPHSEDVVILLDGSLYTPYLGYIYVTEAGRASLNKLVTQGYDRALLFHYYDEYMEINPDLLEAWDGDDFTYRISVTELVNYACYSLYGYDKGLTMAHAHGAVYEAPDGRLYYLNYDALDNSHFDADGYFSYRKGEVDLRPLTDWDVDLLLNGFDDPRIFRDTVVDEDESEGRELTPEEARWVFAVNWFLLVILPGGVIAIVNLNRVKKSDKPKRNQMIALLATLWAFLALLIIVLLLV